MRVQIPHLFRCFADPKRTGKTGHFPRCHQETPHKGKTNTVHLRWDRSDTIFPVTSSVANTYPKCIKILRNEIRIAMIEMLHMESMSNNTGWVVAVIAHNLQGWSLAACPWGWDACSWGRNRWPGCHEKSGWGNCGGYVAVRSKTLVVGRVWVHVGIDIRLALRPWVLVVHVGQ